MTRAAVLSCLAVGLHFASPAAADTLRVIADGDMKTPDPIVTTSWDTQVHAYLIYDKLFEMDETGSPRPSLADTVEASQDRRTFTITLRSGVKFSDGSPIAPDDVIQSLKRWSSRDVTGQLLAARLKSMTTIDARTIRIELNEPFDVPEALAGITGNPAFIMPKRVATNASTDPRAAYIAADDDGERRDVAYQLQKRASEYLPFILTGESYYPRVYRSDIEGFNPAAPRLYFWNITRKSK
ncbi:hypothetical protein ATB98_15710 [Sinorhizobium saheli]|uniref:Solute-binding protein family 5 domain-containing protein n=1 Tax=Sinorhizobium saheli TaxID=36856 RepID=A0A178Y8S9_SINSA|nr:hypothetical protein ATB98_15710 [Sinorhizobium saheli]